MRHLLIIIFFPVYLSSQTDSLKIDVQKEIHYLTKRFIVDPYVILSNDSVVFKLLEDSTIVVDQIWTHDTTKVWVTYRDQAEYDFWELYIRDKYRSDQSINKQLDETPTKFINEFFADKGIKLFGVYIYFSTTGPLLFDLCGTCYQGQDFIFKIEKPDYPYLLKLCGTQLFCLKSNYR
jgi:hypothetical protein